MGGVRGDFSDEANFFDFHFFSKFYFLISVRKLYLDSGGLVEVSRCMSGVELVFPI